MNTNEKKILIELNLSELDLILSLLGKEAIKLEPISDWDIRLDAFKILLDRFLRIKAEFCFESLLEQIKENPSILEVLKKGKSNG